MFQLLRPAVFTAVTLMGTIAPGATCAGHETSKPGFADSCDTAPHAIRTAQSSAPTCLNGMNVSTMTGFMACTAPLFRRLRANPHSDPVQA